MLTDQTREKLAELNPDALLADGLEHAFLGIATRFNTYLACYSVTLILAGYRRDGMTYEEAREFFDFNVAGAWAGEGTPVFLEDDIV